jgi:hypothetical protein
VGEVGEVAGEHLGAMEDEVKVEVLVEEEDEGEEGEQERVDARETDAAGEPHEHDE